MAPELLTPHVKPGAAADIFSLGLMLFELVRQREERRRDVCGLVAVAWK